MQADDKDEKISHQTKGEVMIMCLFLVRMWVLVAKVELGACIFRPKHIIAQQISNILLSGLLLQLVQIKYQLMPQYSIFNPYIDSGRGRIIVGQDLDLSVLCRD